MHFIWEKKTYLITKRLVVLKILIIIVSFLLNISGLFVFTVPLKHPSPPPHTHTPAHVHAHSFGYMWS